jgi:hypothetical protein
VGSRNHAGPEACEPKSRYALHDSVGHELSHPEQSLSYAIRIVYRLEHTRIPDHHTLFHRRSRPCPCPTAPTVCVPIALIRCEVAVAADGVSSVHCDRKQNNARQHAVRTRFDKQRGGQRDHAKQGKTRRRRTGNKGRKVGSHTDCKSPHRRGWAPCLSACLLCLRGARTGPWPGKFRGACHKSAGSVLCSSVLSLGHSPRHRCKGLGAVSVNLDDKQEARIATITGIQTERDQSMRSKEEQRTNERSQTKPRPSEQDR